MAVCDVFYFGCRVTQEAKALRGKLYVCFIHIDIWICNQWPECLTLLKQLMENPFQGKTGPRGLSGKEGSKGEKVINSAME